MAQRFSLCDQRAIAGDLVMLDRLGRPDDSGVENFLVGDFARDLIAFSNQAVNGRALDTLRLLAKLLKAWSSLSICFFVSSRGFLRPVDRSRFVAFSISFGSALTIWCSA
jgi:hypothetical protein